MKTIKVGKLKVNVCEHKGDITYERFVKFKQYAPQFWEKMDSPLFESYYERIRDHFNNNRYWEAAMVLHDYKIALDNSAGSYDAWGVCFALISEVVDGKEDEKFKKNPNDAQIKTKLEELTSEGLKADVVKENVINFMSASPETFQDHLILYASQLTTGEMAKSELLSASTKK